MSKGEDKIERILKFSNIEYIREKVFKDLKRGALRYDFYIPNYNKKQVVIEVNGEQHYKFNKFFYKTRAEWLRARANDRRKISYCLANSIEIYLIPYEDLIYIKTIEDVFNKKYLATSRWENDFYACNKKNKV